MKLYALACLAFLWLADGAALLIAPRLIVSRLRDMPAGSSPIRWELLSVLGGTMLIVSASDLAYHGLWIAVGLLMVMGGGVFWFAPARWRHTLLDWCLNREDLDYRFWGLGQCALALLLLHAIGWIGRS